MSSTKTRGRLKLKRVGKKERAGAGTVPFEKRA
jgi:hypothetical protein